MSQARQFFNEHKTANLRQALINADIPHSRPYDRDVDFWEFEDGSELIHAPDGWHVLDNF